MTSAVLRAWPLPEAGHDKESRGRTLVVGGSAATPGAVLLSAEAALRSGAGKLQVATVDSVAATLAVAVPEALVLGVAQDADGEISPAAADPVVALAEGCASVLLGPGIGNTRAAVALLDAVLPRLGDQVVVIDALALAWVTEHPGGLRRLDGAAVLTPNPNELALTLGSERDAVQRDPLRHTRDLAARTGTVVSCGGPASHVAAPDGTAWRDDAGGLGLGASGSGDVQAGIVAGLAARGASAAQAAVWGAHLHGRAGDRLAASVGRMGFLARELLPEIPRVLAEIEV